MTIFHAIALPTFLSVAVLAAACSPGTQHAQRHEPQHDMSQMQGGHMHQMQNMQSMTPVQRQYHDAMHKMHQAMMHGMMEPDPARSWLKMMAAHHQGAIDMSDVIMRNTTDSAVIAKAQETKRDTEIDLQKIQRMGR